MDDVGASDHPLGMVRFAASRGYGKLTRVRALVANGQEVTMSSTQAIDEETTGTRRPRGTRPSSWHVSVAGLPARRLRREGANMNRVAGAAKV